MKSQLRNALVRAGSLISDDSLSLFFYVSSLSLSPAPAEFKDVGPKSEQEQAFEAQVAINREAQDKILEEISRGLSDLHELATEANKSLVIQAAMLTQVDEKMDNTIASFKVANKRLKV